MKTDKFTLCVYCNFLALLSEQTNCIADENLTYYSFLSRHHYTKSKNYIKDDIEFVTEIPCLLGHPVVVKAQLKKKIDS